MSIFSKKKDPKNLKHIYTDKLGNKWYELNNLMELSRVRYIASSLKELQSDLFNLSAETMIEVFEAISDNINKGQYSKAGAIAEITKAAISDFTDMRLLKKYACVFFFLDDEDPAKYESKFEEKKLQIFEQDSEAMFFFVSEGLKRLNGLESSSEADMLTYLTEIQKRWEDFNLSLGKLKPKSTTT